MRFFYHNVARLSFACLQGFQTFLIHLIDFSQIHCNPSRVSALLVPARCWFWVTPQSSRRTAGAPCCGDATGLWNAWLWHCVCPIAPTPGRSTDGPSGCLPEGSTDWGSPSSPAPCEQSPQPEKIRWSRKWTEHEEQRQYLLWIALQWTKACEQILFSLQIQKHVPDTSFCI